ncbi:hypothetical protein BDI4_450008 [Burkholderia diffusa]|nr:hypothetical protein BDI4_450008 [Burkholderia diffusa]
MRRRSNGARRVRYRGDESIAPQRSHGNAQQAAYLLAGPRLHRELIAFARLYIGADADVQRCMEVPPRYTPQAAIGQANTCLLLHLG